MTSDKVLLTGLAVDSIRPQPILDLWETVADIVLKRVLILDQMRLVQSHDSHIFLPTTSTLLPFE